MDIWAVPLLMIVTSAAVDMSIQGSLESLFSVSLGTGQEWTCQIMGSVYSQPLRLLWGERTVGNRLWRPGEAGAALGGDGGAWTRVGALGAGQVSGDGDQRGTPK